MSGDSRSAVEALRQRQLLSALLARDAGALHGRLQGDAQRIARGLAAYADHADAAAERALGTSFPTLRALLGEASFAVLARAYRRSHPASRGDLFWLGEGLAEFIAAQRDVEPYLADCARLDWLVACAEAAADAAFDAACLGLLGTTAPASLALELRPGSALLASRYCIAAIRDAHADGRFDAAREALAAGRGETVFVWRDGYKARTALLADDERRFVAALLEARSLGAALDAAGAGFDFEAWLARALRAGWLARARRYTAAA